MLYFICFVLSFCMDFGIAETRIARVSPPVTTTEVQRVGFLPTEIRFVSHYLRLPLHAFNVVNSRSIPVPTHGRHNPSSISPCHRFLRTSPLWSRLPPLPPPGRWCSLLEASTAPSLPARDRRPFRSPPLLAQGHRTPAPSRRPSLRLASWRPDLAQRRGADLQHVSLLFLCGRQRRDATLVCRPLIIW
jgi:hypothetical protein